MISFTDILKGNFLAEFSAISVGEMLGAIALAFVLSLFIVYIYRITYAGVSFSRNFAGCMIMIAMGALGISARAAARWPGRKSSNFTSRIT